MRHSAITFAREVRRLHAAGQRWDAVFCSDMLNLAEFLGLAGQIVCPLPKVVYFHENQLTYPARHDEPRDVHFGLTNMSTALAADAVWFNSAYGRDSFLEALGNLLAKTPPPRLTETVDIIRSRSSVQYPGVELPPSRHGARPAGPLRILWAARWEHDKNPGDFFAALDILAASGREFRISVIGEQFRDVPEEFAHYRRRFAERIDRWGYQSTRGEYHAALAEADVAVSTAGHEFFGLSMVEAAGAGAFPLVPTRLAYPEVFQLNCPASPSAEDFFYDGGVADLANRLGELADRQAAGQLWQGDWLAGRKLAERFAWEIRAADMDNALETLQ